MQLKNLLRTYITLIGLLLGTAPALAQCDLNAGAIAFTGFRIFDDGVGGAEQDDEFSFVLLQHVEEGTTIYFTDLGWTDDDAFQSPENAPSDGIIGWIAPEGGVGAGTQVTIRCKYGLEASSGTVQSVLPNALGDGHVSLGIAGDQLFAFLGDVNSPQLLAAIGINTSGWDSSLDADAVSSSRSVDAFAGVGDAIQHVTITHIGGHAYNAVVIGNTYTGHADAIVAELNAVENWQISTVAYPDVVDEAFLLPSAGTFDIHPPTIDGQPGAQAACPEESVIFSVAAAGACGYRWQFSADGETFTDIEDDARFTGADSPSLTINDTEELSGVYFRARIYGTAVIYSEAALLRVADAAPTVTAPEGEHEVTYGESTAFSVTGSEFVSAYQWQVSTNGGDSYTDLAEEGAFSGTDTHELHVGDSGIDMDGMQFRCKVTDICGRTAESTPVELQVARYVLTAGLTGGVTKTYDGDPVAELVAGNYTLSEALPDDAVQLVFSSTGTFDDKNAGEEKVVTVTGLALTGVDAGNYALASTTISAPIGDIQPASLTIQARDDDKVYGSADPELTYSAAGLVGDDDESLLEGVLSREPGEDVDTYAITQGTLDAGGNYTIIYTAADFTITPKSLTVTADAGQSKVYGSADPVLTYAATGFERDDDEDILAGALSREAGEGVDGYSIDIGTLVAGDNYTITYTGADFTITPKTLTVTAGAGQSKVYGSADPVLTYTATGFERGDDESILTGALSRAPAEGVDSYAITQGTLDAGDNYTITYTGAGFTITPKSLTVTAGSGQSKVYGSADPVLTYAATGFERDDDEDILVGVLSREAGEDVDTYAITQGTLSAGANYAIAYTGEDFAITAKTLTVTADADQSKVYGSADPVLTYAATGFERDDDEGILGGTLSRAPGEDVDTYAITQGTLAAGSNYTISYTAADFTITPKTLAITADTDQSKVYGSADPVLTYAATGFEWDDDESVLTGALFRAPGEGVNSYAITQGTLDAGDNYTIAYTGAGFTITPKSLTVTAGSGQSKVYGSADPVLTYTATGFERDDDEDILAGVLSREAGEDVDTYAITQGTLDAGDNYKITYTGAGFTITPKSLTVTADAGQGKVYGSADPALTFEATGFEREDDEDILTGALSREAGEDVDTYAITPGTLSAGANYAIAYTGEDFAITAKTLTVTADADQSKVYGSADPMLTFEVVGFERDDDEGVLTGALSRALGEDVDTYAITQGTLSAGANYTIAYAGEDFAITTKTLTVTADVDQSKVYGSADPALTFDAVGLEWDDDESVLTGVLSRAPGEDVDTYAITQGTLAAGSNYTISYTAADFTITPKTLTVTADAGQGKVYGSADPVLTYATTGFERDDDESVLTGALSRALGEDVDSYVITQGTLSAGANYAIAYTGEDFAITAKTLAVTADVGQSKVYGSADPTLTFEAVGFERDDDESILTGALSRAPGEDVDTYAITQGTLSAGANYTIAYMGDDFAITPKSLAVTANAGQGKVYGSSDPVFTYTATGFAFEENEYVLAGTLSRALGEDVDSYAITQGTLSAGANYTIAYTGKDFAITTKTLTVTADADQSKVYGSADPALTFDAVGFEWDDDESVLTGALSRAPGEDVDTYAITQGTLAVGSNYTIAYTGEDFAITAKALTVTADAGQGKVYGSEDPVLTYVTTGFERDDDESVLTGALSREPGENVDTYAIGQGTLAAGSNYTISYAVADFTITPTTLAITADTDQSKVYGSADSVLTYKTIGFERDDDESIVTGALSREVGEDVDTYAITQGTLSAGANYTIAYMGDNFAITPKSLTVAANAGQGKVYGSADPVLTYTATGFERDDDEGILAGVLSREAGEDVDSYAITQGTLDAGDNYAITYTGAGFAITPKTLTVNAGAGQSKVYGSADPVLTYAATGFERDDDESVLTGALSRAAGEGVNSYAITQGTLAAGSNYTIAYMGTDFTITPKSLAVTADAGQSKVYGSADPTLTFEAVGFERDDDEGVLTGAFSRAPGEDVDTYAITQGTLAAGSNYTISYIAADFTITPKSLTVIADTDQSKVYGSGDPVFTYTTTGFAFEEDEHVLTGALSRAPGEDVDSYAITQGTLSAGANYTIAYTTADFTITPKPLTVELSNMPEITKVYDGTDVATLAAANYVPVGGLPGDDLVISGAAAYGNKDAGTDKEIMVSDFVLDGADAANYRIITTSATTTGTITAKPLTVVLDGHPLITKEYNGSATATLGIDNYTLGGVIGEDEVTIKGTATYEDGNAGTEKGITVSGFVLGGADKANYTVAATEAFTRGTITPKELRVALNSTPVIGKVYDGNDTATLAADNYAVAGIVDGDKVTVTGTAIYADAGVGDNKTVTVTGFVLSGAEAGNYRISTESARTTGRITVGMASATYTDAEISPAAVGKEVTVTISARDAYGHLVTTVPPSAFTVSVSGANSGGMDVANNGDGTYSAMYIPENGGMDELTVRLDGVAIAGSPYRYPVSDFPGTPTELHAEAGNRQVMLEWDAPADVFPAVTDYMIEYSRDGGATWTVPDREPSAATRSLVIGLENNRTYVFRVSAVNGMGQGPASGTVQAIPTEPVPDGEGNLPEPAPGVPIVMTDGKVEAVTLEVIDGEYLKLSGEGYAMELASLGADGERIPISAIDAIIRLLKGTGMQVYVSGHGFEPGTVVTVYLFSTPELVGHLPVGADGRFGGTLPVPADLELGEHTLQANGVVAGGNGERSVSVGLELVDRRPQWVELGALADRTYGDDAVTLNAKSTSNLAVTYTVTDMDGKPTDIVTLANNNRLTIRGAGDIRITAAQAGNADYSAAAPVSRTLHIAKAPLAVSVTDATRVYGEANPVFGLTYSGFVNGEDASALDAQPSTTTEATFASTPGDYMVTISGGVSSNYAFSYQGATLTVTKATQTITFTAPAEVNRDAGSIQLDVSAGSGLPVTLTLDDPQVATLSGSTLNIHRLGTVTITATQAGDGNHEAAAPVTVTMRVTDPSSDFPIRVHQALSPNGDGINEYLIIEGIKDHRENRVSIFSRNGTLLWEASGYDNDRVVFRGISTGQQQLPAGTYFYIVEVKVGGEWKYEKGYFVLRY